MFTICLCIIPYFKPTVMRKAVSIVGLISITITILGGMSLSAVSIEKQMSAEAQLMNNTVPTVSSNRNLDNMTFPGQTIVHQGIVSFEEPTHVTLPPSEELYGASILPHREDGVSYFNKACRNRL